MNYLYRFVYHVTVNKKAELSQRWPRDAWSWSITDGRTDGQTDDMRSQ